MLIVLSLIGCKENSRDHVFSMNTATRPEKELEQLILQKGDASAYYELSIQYLDYGYERFLPFALIMANKYNYPQAYFDVYSCLTDLYGCYMDEELYLLDETTQKMAIEYLQEGSLKGHSQSRETLGEYYMQGIYFEKDTILGKELIKQSENLPY